MAVESMLCLIERMEDRKIERGCEMLWLKVALEAKCENLMEYVKLNHSYSL